MAQEVFHGTSFEFLDSTGSFPWLFLASMRPRSFVVTSRPLVLGELARYGYGP